MVTYNSNLNWYEYLRDLQNELTSSRDIPIQGPHDGVELVEYIIIEEDERIQPHNWDTSDHGEDNGECSHILHNGV